MQEMRVDTWLQQPELQTRQGCRDLASAEGNLALGLSEIARAKHLYGHALPVAQKQGNKFLVMQIKGNLGVVALRQERFDATQDLFQRADAIANALQARLAQEKYLAMPLLRITAPVTSPVRECCIHAAQQAAALGASVDQVRWSNNLGLCERRLHHVLQTQAAFEKALQIATKIGSEEQAAESHVDLGALFADTNTRAAEQHARPR